MNQTPQTPPRTKLTTIDLEHLDSGTWRATQPGVGLVGRGPNPGRAVAHYAELVAETVYESGEYEEDGRSKEAEQ